MTGNDAGFDGYWRAVEQEVAALADSLVQVEELPLRSNEVSVAYGLRFRGIGDYPLFAYFCVPRSEGPHVPLFQAPGYGSVVGVPSFERRDRYAVMALCHRGQRLSNSQYRAAYPGLLTDGLPGAETYRWREIVADCLRAVDVLLARPEIDRARLAASGNDLALITAALRPQVASLLVLGPMLFADVPARSAATSHVYPQQEWNDFRRTYPDVWPEAEQTASLFDPQRFAPRVKARTLIHTGAGEQPVAQRVASAIPGGAEVRVASGQSYLDHMAQENWLASAAGVPVNEGPFLSRK